MNETLSLVCRLRLASGDDTKQRMKRNGTEEEEEEGEEEEEEEEEEENIRWRRSFGGTGPVIGPKLLAPLSAQAANKDYTPACPEGNSRGPSKRFRALDFSSSLYI